MKFSTYQEAILNFVQHDSGNLQVQACAGSGKSFTIKHSVRVIPQTIKTVFVGAFNKHIQIPLAAEIPQFTPPHAQSTIQTLNGFGWGICRAEFGRIQLDKDKTFSILQATFDMRDARDKSRFWKWQKAIVRLVSLFKANNIHGCPPLDAVETLMEFMGIERPYDNPTEFYQTLEHVYSRALGMTQIMDFDDQIFMPIYLGLSIPRFNLGLVDELQDLNPIQMELMIAASDRIAGVGDRRQAIYGFRGADVRAMDTFIKRTAATCLPLSICYRCPKKVVQLAQGIVGAEFIQPADDAPDGIIETVKLGDFRKNAKADDYVLCRTTAPIVSECLKFIQNGQKATVKGRDIGIALIDLIDKVSKERDSMAVDEFFTSLNKYFHERIEQLSKRNADVEIQLLTDRVDTVKVLLEACSDVKGIKRRIQDIFTDNVQGIVLCTVHKAKGLEADRIWILRPDLMPHPNAEQEWQIEQEKNLQYVAYTRVVYRRDSNGVPCTQGELYFVTKS